MQSNVRLWLQFCYRVRSDLGSLSFVHPHQLTQEGEEEGHGDKEGQHIGDGLADLNAQQPEGPGQGEDERDEKHALTARKVARPDLPMDWNSMLPATITGCSSMAKHW